MIDENTKIKIPLRRENLEKSEVVTRNKSLAIFADGMPSHHPLPSRSMRKKSSIIKSINMLKTSDEEKAEITLAPIVQYKIREKLKNRNFFQKTFATRAFQKIGIGQNQLRPRQKLGVSLQFVDDTKVRVNVRHYKLMVDHEKEHICTSEQDILLRL